MKIAGIPNNEMIIAMTPVGKSAEKKSFRDKMIKQLMKTKQRKNIDKIFFNEIQTLALYTFLKELYKKPKKYKNLKLKEKNA